jgi:transposase-like protein
MKTDLAVTTEERARLADLIADRNSPAKVVWRARIVLSTAEGKSVKAICRATGVSKPCVWRWQKRFAEAGVDGLLRDKTRPPGPKTARGRNEGQGVGEDCTRDAAGRDALERAHNGNSDGHQPHQRAAHLARGRPQAAPHGQVQGL